MAISTVPNPVTVKHLIELLESLPQDLTVVLSGDPEGNDFSPVDYSYSVLYWDEVEQQVVGPDDKSEYEEDNEVKLEQQVVVLWPS